MKVIATSGVLLTEREVLNRIGDFLASTFEKCPPQLGEKLTGRIAVPSESRAMVLPGELCVAVTDQGSRNLIRTILSIYYHTTKCYPRPHHIMFCSESTRALEIDLFLDRCKMAPKNNQGGHLFCLVQPELLKDEVHFALVDKLRDMVVENDSAKDFMLALVCCNREQGHDYLVEKFAQFARFNVPRLSDEFLEESCRKLSPDMLVVTSDTPGLGEV